jgi:hypothetical protein
VIVYDPDLYFLSCSSHNMCDLSFGRGPQGASLIYNISFSRGSSTVILVPLPG